MIWMNSRVRPPLAWRTVRTSSARPGMNRSSPIRRSGPLGMSRMPVASTTSAPGWPRAKRSYHARTSGVTNPSSVARHGTIAGTQVRSRSSSRPERRGLNQSDRAASSAVGGCVGGMGCLTKGSGCHTLGNLTIVTLSAANGALARAVSLECGGDQTTYPFWPPVIRIALGTLLLLTVPDAARAQNSGTQTEASRAPVGAVVDSIARDAIRRGVLAGMVVIAVHRQDTLLARAYGQADLENDVPMTVTLSSSSPRSPSRHPRNRDRPRSRAEHRHTLRSGDGRPHPGGFQ